MEKSAFHFPYDFLKESTVENDTIMFRFAVTDSAGNKSDTVDTTPIVIHLSLTDEPGRKIIPLFSL